VGQRPPLQANSPQLPILPAENHIIIPRLPNVPNVLPVSHVHMSCHVGWSTPGRTRLPCTLQPVCKRHTHTMPPRRVSAVCGRYGSHSHVSRSVPSHRYLAAYLGRLELWLRNWRIAINVSKSTAVLFAKAARRVRQPMPVQFLGEPIEWVQTARYLGVTFDTRLTWSTLVNRVRKRVTQRLGVLGPLLNRRSGLSVRNGVLLCKQLLRPMMD
jgi:hypothetical protein